MPSFFSILLIIAVVLIIMRWPKQKKAATQSARSSGYSRWIGGGLGWAFGGPLGALLGYTLGRMAEGTTIGNYESQPTQRGDFNASLLVLTAAVMKADGSVKRAELDYVKRFLLHNFGKEAAEQYLLMLKELIKQEIKVAEVAQQIGRFMEYPSKLQLLHYLFGISISDGSLHDAEDRMITSIAALMGIQPADFASIRAMFVKDDESAYKILEISKNATDEEVKKAYREMAMKYHPDKVSHLGEEVRKAAESKFQHVSEAYETIKKQRGIR